MYVFGPHCIVLYSLILICTLGAWGGEPVPASPFVYSLLWNIAAGLGGVPWWGGGGGGGEGFGRYM